MVSKNPGASDIPGCGVVEHGACKSCGAPIIWAITDSGKRIPLDAKPVKRFTLSGMVSIVDVGTGPAATMADTYGTHFVTCPNAAQHRRSR